MNYSFARATLTVDGVSYTYYDLHRVAEKLKVDLSRMPFSLRILLESLVRQMDGKEITQQHVERLLAWQSKGERQEIGFRPARIVLQDFTGVPAVVDLAALRSAVDRAGGDASQVNPAVAVDLVIDHSVMVDRFGDKDALAYNVEQEFSRNWERYRLLRWAAQSFRNFRVVPPSVGIVHQVNLEYLAKVVMMQQQGEERVLFPDTLVGTDSHTTMINGLGVLGWGVGGIEAEACMLGHPLYFLVPEVVCLRLTGALAPGATATDLALTVTEQLRSHGVVGKFVEINGPGLANLSLADRATVANMSPEYGATVNFFPVDKETLRYLDNTGREEHAMAVVEAYCQAQGLWWDEKNISPDYSATIELDLGSIVPSLAGPKRPQDRVALSSMKETWRKSLGEPVEEFGFAIPEQKLDRQAMVQVGHEHLTLKHGSVVLAAITSCTNTSNPSVMIGAGLLAKKALEYGLKVSPAVKCSLTPGSRVVTNYLERAGLLDPLAQLGFYIAGYGCATCIGNSGPLVPAVEEAIHKYKLTVASVLSGNRNFEGRIHPLVKANYLASPPLVVAYALAGTVDIDFETEPLGQSADGKPIYLRDVWPAMPEIQAVMAAAIEAQQFRDQYAETFTANQRWNELPTPEGLLYEWDANSSYIQEPPFLQPDHLEELAGTAAIEQACILALLGDSVTTDHISPAGAIAPSSPAGLYLQELGIKVADFNSYGSRRGNDRVMMRGTFANVRIRNAMVAGKEGGFTHHLPSGEVVTIYEAAKRYKEQGIPLVVIAGKEYGTGSSRDWAAKGTRLLGVRVVIAESYERIHRINLVGMGVLPLQFLPEQSWQNYQLTGHEILTIPALGDRFVPQQQLKISVQRPDGETFEMPVLVRIDSEVEFGYYLAGGILPIVLKKLLGQAN